MAAKSQNKFEECVVIINIKYSNWYRMVRFDNNDDLEKTYDRFERKLEAPCTTILKVFLTESQVEKLDDFQKRFGRRSSERKSRWFLFENVNELLQLFYDCVADNQVLAGNTHEDDQRMVIVFRKSREVGHVRYKIWKCDQIIIPKFESYLLSPGGRCGTLYYSEIYEIMNLVGISKDHYIVDEENETKISRDDTGGTAESEQDIYYDKI